MKKHNCLLPRAVSVVVGTFSRLALQSRQRTHRTCLGTARWRYYDLGLGCSALRCGRCRIEFAVALLDPPRADMALHREADVVWAIAGTCRVKFLSGFARREGENTLAQTRALRAGLTSRRCASGCSWRPPAASRRNRSLCFGSGSRSGSPTGWRLADPGQRAGARHRNKRTPIEIQTIAGRFGSASQEPMVRRLTAGGNRIRTLGSPPKVSSVHPRARRDPRRHREAGHADRLRRRARRAICGGKFPQ